MKPHKNIELDFEVDKLTNSIENAVSGEVFDTLITLLKTADRKQVKKAEWTFNWQTEIKDKAKQVYKLTTANNPTVIHGLVSLTDKADHIFMDLIESENSTKAKANSIKVYRAILLLLPANFHLKKAMKAWFLLFPRHNLFNIMSRH